MPLDVRCGGCGKMLRVADEHAGKALRCPACNHISTAPAAGTTAVAAPVQAWHMRTPEGQTFGPVAREELDRWVGEGRIAVDCMLSQSPTGPWEPAAALFPQLMLQMPKPAPPPTPQYAAAQYPPASPVGVSPYSPMGAPGRFLNPHRGGLILVLGLVGIIMGCPVFSIMAWVMGSGDLQEMRAGRMDPSGEGLTQAGKILGMIPSILFIMGAVLVMMIIVVAAIAGR